MGDATLFPWAPEDSGTDGARLEGSDDAEDAAQVILDSPVPHLDHEFDYAVPRALDADAVVGARVRVPFGGSELNGFIVGRGPVRTTKALVALKKVYSPLPVLNQEIYALAKKVAQRYCGTTSDVLRAAVPSRMARVESEFTYEEADGAPSGYPHRTPGVESLAGYPGSEQLLDSLRNGGSPRLALTSYQATGAHGRWQQFLSLIEATLASDRSVLVIVPDQGLLEQFVDFMALHAPALWTVSLDAEEGPTARYRNFLTVLTERAHVVVGLRAACFAPVRNLGLILCWDDGDPSYAERRAPYHHAREVLLMRAALKPCALVFAGHARSVPIQRLVENGYLQSLSLPRALVRKESPAASNARDSYRQSHDPYADVTRIPTSVFAVAREALHRGPVLFQVTRAGYAAALRCSTCFASARCAVCGGPLYQSSSDAPVQCRWCHATATTFTCAVCHGHRLERSVPGQSRTVEEIGKAFPGVNVVSSAAGRIVRKVSAAPALVVATVGAEPYPAEGYAAVILLDGDSLLALEGLTSAEDAARRWFNAAALARPRAEGGEAVIVATASPAADAIVRWDPAGFAERELAQRTDLALPPSVRLAVVSGELDDVEAFVADLSLPEHVRVAGPFPEENRPSVVTIQRTDSLGVLADESPAVAQTFLFFPYSVAEQTTHELRSARVRASLKRDHGAVRIQCDDVSSL